MNRISKSVLKMVRADTPFGETYNFLTSGSKDPGAWGCGACATQAAEERGPQTKCLYSKLRIDMLLKVNVDGYKL
ncbi:hypothetical protein JTE90_005450 [Oedothorax gibbosus]|uniref:Uncharacterized protein n=1 Tax=Oedothorax gibbosus TaxID=931172 RepID=A0AAV6U632_9ARAC|nr:hypothetical protein JTE90_005450 [Oedothorax gibbosus]